MRDIEKFFQEMKYEEEYTYEERIELFNHFGISTSQKYFCPFYSYVSMHIFKRKDLFSFGYSHSGNLATLSNKFHFQQKTETSLIEQARYGPSYNELYLIRNKNTQELLKVKGKFNIWKLLMDVKTFNLEFEINFEELEKMKPEDWKWTKNNIEINSDRANLFLKLTGFK